MYFLELFKKNEEEENLPNSTYEENIMLVSKPDKDISRKET